VQDIEGTRPIPQTRTVTGHFDALVVRDITDAGIRKSERDT
jgi:hypothetical protein